MDVLPRLLASIDVHPAPKGEEQWDSWGEAGLREETKESSQAVKQASQTIEEEEPIFVSSASSFFSFSFHFFPTRAVRAPLFVSF